MTLLKKQRKTRITVSEYAHILRLTTDCPVHICALDNHLQHRGRSQCMQDVAFCILQSTPGHVFLAGAANPPAQSPRGTRDPLRAVARRAYIVNHSCRLSRCHHNIIYGGLHSALQRHPQGKLVLAEKRRESASSASDAKAASPAARL